MTPPPLLQVQFPVLLISALILCWCPSWGRRSVFFGVTIAPDFRRTSEARAALAQYRVEIVIWTVLSFLLASLDSANPLFSRPLIASIFLQTFGGIVSFARSRNRIRLHAIPRTAERIASLAPEEKNPPGGWMLALPPFLLLLATGLYLQAHWDQIPERFAIHWNLAGEPNGWANKTWLGVYGALLLGAGLNAMLLAIGYGILHGARRGSRFQRANVLFLVAQTWVMSGVFSCTALLSLHRGPSPGRVWILTAAILAFVFGSIWRLARLSAEPRGEDEPGDATPDDCWKWGQFYYNPQDPAFMVEKRFGIGYTMNFGHKLSWVLMALILLLPLSGILLINK